MIKSLSKRYLLLLCLPFFTQLFFGCAPKVCPLQPNIQTNIENFCEKIAISYKTVRQNENKELQLIIKNLTNAPYELVYRIDWKDKNGFFIDSRLSRWQLLRIEAGRDAIINSVAPIKESEDFLIKIEYPTNADYYNKDAYRYDYQNR